MCFFMWGLPDMLWMSLDLLKKIGSNLVACFT